MKWALIIGFAALFPAALAAQPADAKANAVGKLTETSNQPSVVLSGSAEHQRLVAFLARTQSALTGLGPTNGDFYVTHTHQQVTSAGAAHQPFEIPPPPYDTTPSSVANSIGDTLSIDICSDGQSQAWLYVFGTTGIRKDHSDQPGWKVKSYSTLTKDCASQK